MEIVLDALFGFLVLDIHALCQSESGNTIDDSEIGSLCFFALSISDLRNVFVPYFGSCSRMDVVAFAEGFRHIGILAEMGHDA